MQIKEIMTENVEVIQPGTSVKDAAAMMKDLDAGVLPVIDGSNLAGVLTDRDIVIRSTAEGNNPNEVRAGDIISEDLAVCHDNEEVETVAARMRENKIRRLPVVDRDNQLVGIVSLGDLAVEADERMAGETLEEISKPGQPER
ncbi:MAG: CBS domain-containing protein [Candidatus Krumholzibacteriales bacterium]